MVTVNSGNYMLWEAAVTVGEKFSGHYSASWDQQHALFVEALKLNERDWIVELGVCNGRTAAILARAAQIVDARYIGIDNFGLENSAVEIRGLFDKYGLPGEIWDANTHVAGLIWQSPINLLFIDAGHDEANVKPDIELWVKWVRRDGVVAFHDWDEPYDRGSPHWAIRFYGEQATQGWERLESPIVMAMFRRPL